MAAPARQLDLFGAPDVGPAPCPDAVAQLARALPEEIRLGTSSWSFPGWRGIVYDRTASRTTLARAGLAAYAKHPLLRTVGLDRTYYDPLDVESFERLAQTVPDGFRFLAKAHRDCTTPRADNPRYLDPHFASEAVVGPWSEGLGDRRGPLVFQFPPQRGRAEEPERFAARLFAFLSALPQGPVYAVEIRHRPWLTGRFGEALAAARAVPCLTVHPTMPAPATQTALLGGPEAWPAIVVRWMLGGGRAYQEARERYAPFDRLLDPDPVRRREIAELCRRASAAGRPATVTINNKAEGSAPLSALELAREIGGR